MSNSPLYISVIIATYNMPQWLKKVLHGYNNQTYKYFEILVADDGSGVETRNVIEDFKSKSEIQVTHLWHEDKGYRRQTILNKAILKASYDYILFTDGDCIPRNDFLTTHAQLAEKKKFLSGGYCKLPMTLSKLITEKDIDIQRCFEVKWLREKGLKGASQIRKLGASEEWGKFLDLITPAQATFNNCNTSVWKEYLFLVNGYDERMQYGGADREIGERLENAGVKGKQVRHRAICLHLDHGRGYKTKESLEKNLAIRKTTRKDQIIQTSHGLRTKS